MVTVPLQLNHTGCISDAVASLNAHVWQKNERQTDGSLVSCGIIEKARMLLPRAVYLFFSLANDMIKYLSS